MPSYLAWVRVQLKSVVTLPQIDMKIKADLQQKELHQLTYYEEAWRDLENFLVNFKYGRKE